jgi:hypothetical protein
MMKWLNSCVSIELKVAADVPHAKFEDFFAGIKYPLYTGAELFDVFQLEHLPKVIS